MGQPDDSFTGAARMRSPFATFAALHPMQRLSVTLRPVLLIGVTGKVRFAPVRSHTVVPIYIAAAERFARGEPLYVSTPPLDWYRNPPGIAAAFIPLTLVPERLAGL